MIEVLDSVLIAIFVYGLAIVTVVSFHELGHFIAARLFGIHIESVSVGFGKRIWSRKDKYDTEWIFRAFCLGGYVHLSGEDRFQKDKTDIAVFNQLSLAKRFLTVLAGPIFNFILPFILFFLAYASFGQPSYYPVITGVELGREADLKNLQPGDLILSINGETIERSEDTGKFFTARPPTLMSFEILRDGQEIRIDDILPEVVSYTNTRSLKKEHPYLGVLLTNSPRNIYFIDSVDGIETNNEIDLIRELLIERFNKEVILGVKSPIPESGTAEYRVFISEQSNQGLLDPEDNYYEAYFLGAPEFGFYQQLNTAESIKISAKHAGQMVFAVLTLPLQMFPIDTEKLRPYTPPPYDYSIVKYWFFTFIYATALLSAALGFVNLLPFPGLDGSYLLYYAAESLKGPEFVKKNKGLLVAGSLFLIYFIALTSNINKIGPYLAAVKERTIQRADFIAQKYDLGSETEDPDPVSLDEKTKNTP